MEKDLFEFHINLYHKLGDKWAISLSNNPVDSRLIGLKTETFNNYKEAKKEYDYLVKKKDFNSKSELSNKDNPTILSIWKDN